MIYMDNAATSFPKAPGLAAAISDQLMNVPGNPGRGNHSVALAADRLLFDAREAVAGMIGASDAGRLVFTKNATEAINIVLLGSVGQGAVIATSSLEHNAVMRPLRWLEQARGAKIIIIPFDEEGRPDRESLASAVSCRPAMAVFTMASNVTGAILPWEELAGLFSKAGSLVCLDGSQFIGHHPFAIDAVPFDFLCFPGHKGLLGPTGTGGLYLAGDRFPQPLIRGGTGSHSASEEQPEELPDRFEAGTQNLSGAAGLLHAASYLSSVGIDCICRRERTLTDRLLLGLHEIPGLRVYGPALGIERVPVVSLRAEGLSLDWMTQQLDDRGIVVRKGLQCAPEAHRSIGSLGGGGTIRFSPGFFSTEEEIDETLQAMELIMATSGGGKNGDKNGQ